MNNVNGNAATVIGNGIGYALTGISRMTALSANCVVLLSVAELAIRFLQTGLKQSFGIEYNDKIWFHQRAKDFNECGARPFRDVPLMELIKQTAGFAILSIGASEFTRFTCGEAHSIYNDVMPFLGPMRIDGRPYSVAAAEVLRKYSLIN